MLFFRVYQFTAFSFSKSLSAAVDDQLELEEELAVVVEAVVVAVVAGMSDCLII